MARPRGKFFSVDTRPTKVALVNSLTRDITVEACVFDLIDNSVDAARDAILAKCTGKAVALPDSYDGFDIELQFSGDGFAIVDNCGGISVNDLKVMVLRFGEPSSHTLGIGIFGLGLNRALFKLGETSHLRTDTGTERAELILNTTDYLASDDWNLPAEEFKSSGEVGTSLEATHLSEEVANKFTDQAWVEDYRTEVGRRYGRFIKKGLKVKVNGVTVEDGEVEIRRDGPFKEEYKVYKVKDVSIHLRAGQHELHRFSAEPDYEKAKNAQLTEDYGWTVLCNDRAVIMSDRSWKTGWDGKFHTEFYGFVGTVNFISNTPSHLPWDTTKSDVDLNNRAYQAALADMRKFAMQWRSSANQAKTKKRNQQPLLPLPGVPSDPNPPGPKPPAIPAKIRKQRTIKKLTKKIDHNQLAEVLPHDIDEGYCDDKHLALVHEAKALSLRDFPYAGMQLIRSLFEISAVKYFDRLGKLGDVRRFAVDERTKKGNKIPDINAVVLNLDEYLAFLEQNPGIWGAVKATHLKQALRHMGARKKLLNGVVHNPYQSINGSEAFAVRDEVLPILRHLIEQPAADDAV